MRVSDLTNCDIYPVFSFRLKKNMNQFLESFGKYIVMIKQK